MKYLRQVKCKQVCLKFPSCTLHCTVCICKWWPPNTLWYLSHFVDDTSLYVTDRMEDFVLRKLQRGLSSMETWCERQNIKLNEEKTRGIYFSHRRGLPESHIILNERNISFANSVTFDRKITWWLHIEMIEAKTSRTFIRVYSLFRGEWLSANIKSTLHKCLIKNIMTHSYPTWIFATNNHLINLHCLRNKVLRIIGDLPRSTPVRDLQMVFKLL
jgi:hypothetical protein